MPAIRKKHELRSVAISAALALMVLAVTIFVLKITASNVKPKLIPEEGLTIVKQGDAMAGPSSSEGDLFNLTDADRRNNGVAPLEFDLALLLVARQRAMDQLQAGRLTHYYPDGQVAIAELLGQAGLPYTIAGENLAQVPSTVDGPVDVERAWMESPGHRANILDERFSRAAVGLAKDSTGTVYAAAIFRDD